MYEARLADMVGKLDAEELLNMHEFLQQGDCHHCMTTGRAVTVQDLPELGLEVIGIDIDEDCPCCAGLGFHYRLSLN